MLVQRILDNGAPQNIGHISPSTADHRGFATSFLGRIGIPLCMVPTMDTAQRLVVKIVPHRNKYDDQGTSLPSVPRCIPRP